MIGAVFLCPAVESDNSKRDKIDRLALFGCFNTAMDKNEFLEKLELMRAAFVYSSVGAPHMGQIAQTVGRIGNWDLTEMKTGWLLRKNGGQHMMHIEQYFTPRAEADVSGLQNIVVLRAWAKLFVLELQDWVVQSKMLPATEPELQFLRHVRNAVSHGERFDLRGMRYPAEFDGIEIIPDLDGTWLWDLVEFGDLVALVENIKERIVALP